MTLDAVLGSRLTARLATEQSSRRLPSISAAWARDGEVCWQQAIGHLDGHADGESATPDTQYRIGSITKTLVAVTVLQARAAGLLALTDPLEKFFPASTVGSVTIQDLLSHAAGMRAETAGPWWERTPGIDWPTLLGQLTLRDWVIHQFHYSNVGFAVLAAIVEKINDTPWFALIQRDLLDPLGMNRTSARPRAPHAAGSAVHPHADLVHREPEHDAGAMAPAGQLWSTTGDLLRWAEFLRAGDDRILDRDAVTSMRRPLTWIDDPGLAWTTAWGLGLEVVNVEGERRFGHGGSMPGFQAGLRFRESGDAVVVLANTTSGLSSAFTADVFALVDEYAPVPPPVWTAEPAHQRLLELTGSWFWGPAAHTLRVTHAGRLELTPVGAGRGARFAPLGPDRWMGLDEYFAGEELVVVRRDGVVSHLDIASFRFTRTPYDWAADIPGGVDDLGWH